jgi:hypothetical protein
MSGARPAPGCHPRQFPVSFLCLVAQLKEKRCSEVNAAQIRVPRRPKTPESVLPHPRRHRRRPVVLDREFVVV